MAFSKQQLQKFSNLIKIDISDEKLNEMNLDSIVEWLDKLQKIDTNGVEPMLSPVDNSNYTRPDIVETQNIRDKILANTPDDTGNSRGYFAVPKVIDDE